MLTLLSALALATQPEPDIVITGRKEKRNEIAAQIRDATTDVDGQYPRFRTPICPVVAGLPETYGETVVARVRAMAEEAGIPLAKRPCEANIFVVFTNDPRATIGEVKRKKKGLFGLMSNADYDALLGSGGPAYAFRSSIPRRRDGGRVQGFQMLEIDQGGMASQKKRAARGAYKVDNAFLSRLSEPVRRDTDQAWVVIDSAALNGRSLAQIGDYAAMATLAPVDTAKRDALPYASILALFDEEAGSGEPGATAYDRALLSGLYSSRDGIDDRKASKRIAQSLMEAEEQE